jgi:hypothetical protein
MRVQWRVSPKRGSNPRSPKASLAFLAGETAASGIMSAQAARALDASHRQGHPPGRRTPSGNPRITPSPWTAASATMTWALPVAVVVPEPPGRGVVPTRATHCAQRASPQASSSDRPGDEMASHMLSERTRKREQRGSIVDHDGASSPMRCLSARATPCSVVTPLAWLASQAWPRLMPCFDGEASEVLIHPLGPAFNVGDDHANHLSNGHALWAAGTGVRRQKFSRVSQPRNNASAHSLVNIIPSLSTPSYPISARRHKVIRAPSVGLRLRIRIFSQESGGQEPKHERRSGVASRASHGVPSFDRLMMLLTPSTDQGAPLALGTLRALSA